MLPLVSSIVPPSTGGSDGQRISSVQSGRQRVSPCSEQVWPSPLKPTKHSHSCVWGPVWVQVACPSQSALSSSWQRKAALTSSSQLAPVKPSTHWQV